MVKGVKKLAPKPIFEQKEHPETKVVSGCLNTL